MRPDMSEVEGMTARDESGEQAILPSQGSVGKSYECTVRDARAMMSDEEFWEHVFVYREENWLLLFSRHKLDYYDPDTDFPDPADTHELNKPCTECGEFICGYDYQGRPMYHNQRQEDD